MELPIIEDVFTKELTNSSLVIVSSMGVKKVSVFNATSTAGSVTGARQLGAVTSTALTVSENDSVNITASQESSILNGITITAPSGCTLSIIAVG